MNATDVRFLARMADEFGATVHDRSEVLSRRFNVSPPARRGGAEAIRQYVVHHTAGSITGTYDDIWRYHTRPPNGWDAPGYSIFVLLNGLVEVGVLPSRLTYGVLGRHTQTLNVCLPGTFCKYRRLVRGEWVDGEDHPTPAQLDALYRVLCVLDDTVGSRPWRGHGEVALRGHGTACPGVNLLRHVKMMRGSQWGAADERPRYYGEV